MTDPYLYEERAAIIQYCGNVSKQEAERLAREDMKRIERAERERNRV